MTRQEMREAIRPLMSENATAIPLGWKRKQNAWPAAGEKTHRRR